MGARWLQQKKLKQKRMRRAWAKRYSMSGAGLDPNASFLNEKGKSFSLTLRSRSSVASSQFQDEDKAAVMRKENPLDRIIQEVFAPSALARDHTPGVLYARRAGLHADHLVLAELFQKDFGQGEKIWQPVSLVKSPVQNVWMFFSSEECFILNEIIRGGVRTIRKSIHYPALALAKQAWQTGRVCYVDEPIIIIPDD